MKNRVLLLMLFILLGIILAYYFTQRDYRNDIQGKKPDFKLTASELFEFYNSDETNANTRFLGKILVVDGEVSSLDKTDDKITLNLDTGDLMSEIVCEMNTALYNYNAEIIVGQAVSLKCECAGKLMDVNLVNCVFNK